MMLRSLILAGAVTLAGFTAVSAQPRGSYAASCTDIRQRGPVLEAECRDVRGRFRSTRLDLRNCPGGGSGGIANNNGQLTCGGGGGGRQRLDEDDDRSRRRGYDRRDYGDDRGGYDRGGYDRQRYRNY